MKAALVWVLLSTPPDGPTVPLDTFATKRECLDAKRARPPQKPPLGCDRRPRDAINTVNEISNPFR